MKSADAQNNLSKRLRWPLRFTWAGLVAERFLRAFWPVYSLVFTLVAAFLFGVQERLPFVVVVGLLAAVSVLLLATLVRAVARFRFPHRSESLARLDSTLVGQPLAALTDAQTVGLDDPASRAVWGAHLRRMEAKTASAQAPWPDLRLADRDPNGLRLMAVTALLAAVIFGAPKYFGSVTIFSDNLLAGQGEAGAQWEGWIQPPSYTGKPTLYLNDLIARSDLQVPEGSVIALRFYDESSANSLKQNIGTLPTTAQASADFGGTTSLSLSVEQSGELSIKGAYGGDWSIEMLADAAPDVRLSAPPVATLDGELRQEFRASDDYGVAAGTLHVTLDLNAVDRRYGLHAEPDPQEDLVLDLPLAFSAESADFTETAVEDFAPNLWAGLPVTLALQVEDDLEQTSAIEIVETTLPKRKFFHPLAASVVEARRDILWARSNGLRAEQVLRAVMHVPQDMNLDESGFLMLRVALQRLAMANIDGLNTQEQMLIADALWEIALRIEEGGLEDAKARLERAQDRLAEAMERGASDEEIAELMDELREAMDDYVKQLAQTSEPNPDQQNAQNQDSTDVTQDEIDALMDQIQDLMEQGRMAEAQQLLEMLREMMENMQVTQGGEGNGPQTPAERAMDDLQETLRDQQDLSDEAFRNLQERYNPSTPQGQDPSARPSEDGQEGEGATGEQQLGEGGGNGDEETDQGQPGGSESLAQRQQALRDELSRQEQALGEGSDGGSREALDRAGRAMEEAENALEDEDIPLALDRQSEAIEELREGMRALGQAMAEDSNSAEGENGQTAQGEGRDGGDPLGRAPGTSGASRSDSPFADGENPYGRARELLDELRRREGDKTRPDQELEYLRRLIDQF
ncbi:TIGR02302 family protein [Falsihalocynthiibacter sp. S25ZX9]|uniref:TIGR02302 family protein n=1 Tax=Falsihalocynthiibacter sp. S25ZX9 TaxID=3240870 RepID=UPI00350F472E